jgi:L,D-peptidoglycan transpeptidase YkuD (ErfK/YbiS/YcfS/YnhG family)
MMAMALAALCACAHTGPGNEPQSRWGDARQLVLVTVPDWDADAGELTTYQRAAAGQPWREVGEPAPVTVGRGGSGWGLGMHPAQSDGPVKREGDGRAPAGVFRIGTAFGYAPQASTALPYAPMDAGDYCIDVPASPLYNRIVDSADVGVAAIEGSTEPMRRDLHADGDQRYRLGFVVEHNGQAVPRAGSCIFAHLWKTPDTPTAGCTAMAPQTMDRLLRWLQPEQAPVFILLPEAERRRLRRSWGLPGPG